MLHKSKLNFCFSTFSIIATLCAAGTACSATEIKSDKVTTPVLQLKSETFDSNDINSFAMTLMEFEGPRFNVVDAVNEAILGACINDLYTTAPNLPKSDISGMSQSILAMKLRNFAVGETTVTQQDIADWMKDNAKTYERKEQVKGKHLFMQVKEDSATSKSDTVKKNIEKVRKEIMAGLPFEKAVTKYSESSTSATGGNLGYLSYRQPLGDQHRPMNIILDNALFSLQPGQLSDVLKTGAGYHLVFCEDRLTTHVPTVEELTTSGILPGSAQEKIVAEKLKLWAKEAAEKHKIAPVKAEASDKLTTESNLITCDGKNLTATDFGNIFGERFLAFFEENRENTDKMNQLKLQLTDMIGSAMAAKDRELDKKEPKLFALLGNREKFTGIFAKIQKDTKLATDEDAQKFFDTELEKKEKSQFRLRKPEYAGYVVTVEGKKEDAEKVLKELKAIDNEKDLQNKIKDISIDDRKSSAGLVPLHPANTLEDTPAKQFDMFAASIEKGSWIPAPQQLEKGWLIVKVTDKQLGQPVNFTEVKEQIKRYLDDKRLQDIRATMLKDAADKELFKFLDGAKDLGLEPNKN